MKLSTLIDQMKIVLEKYGDKDVMVYEDPQNEDIMFGPAVDVGTITLDVERDKFVVVSVPTADFIEAGP